MSNQKRWEIPDELIKKASHFFAPPVISAAKVLILQSKTSLSFEKGDESSFYIVSGICKENKTFECKLIYKKRLLGTENGPLSGSCTCPQYTDKNFCSHVASLFFIYHLGKIDRDLNVVGLENLPPLAILHNYAVGVDEYGTIIGGPHKLVGAPSNSTYSTLQYLLHTKKVVNFPLPEQFEGKLVISFNKMRAYQENSFEPYLPELSFQYKNNEDELIHEISVFENLYLFNWKVGKTYHLPSALKDLVQKIRINESLLEINELIRLTRNEEYQKYCEIIINGIPLPNHEIIPVTPRVEISGKGKKGQLEFNLHFVDEAGIKGTIPQFLKLFTFTGGHLSSFKRKLDAYLFIENLCDYFQEKESDFKRGLITSSQKRKFENNINFLMNHQTTLVYDHHRNIINSYDNELLKNILLSLFQSFGEMFFRYGVFKSETQDLTFLVYKNTIFSGLSTFNRRLSPYGLKVFYNDKEVGSWKSKIRFERRSFSTNWFDLELEIPNEDLEVIRKSDLENGLMISDNGLILLTKEDQTLLKLMKKYTTFETEEEHQEEGMTKFLLPFKRARIFELFELKKLGIEGALTEDEHKLCERLASLEKMPQYPPPPEFKKFARPYQLVGYNWLRFLYENKLGACLADDMGLGKTLQVIGLLESIYDKINRCLIVCPVSILLNWEKEIQKFSNMDIYIFHGGERSIPDDKKIILTSYGVMKKEAEGHFHHKHFDILILDEVQHLKNIRSQGANAARKLNADFRIALTGTPVENDLSEFYNILDLSIPGIWGELGMVKTTNKKKSRPLARKTASPFILRRTKAQVLTDLPDKIENNVYLSFSEEEQNTYVGTLEKIRNRITHSPGNRKYGEILKGLLELRQRCLWNYNVDEGPLKENIKKIKSTKIEFLLENLEQIIEEGHQAIIFSQFTKYMDLIEYFLREKHWNISRIDGTQSINKRQLEVDKFQDHKTQIFLISLKAGGVGLNLTAASYVFIMDPWWNPAVESQAIDRAHRIGQKNTLTVYRPIIKNSVEEKVLELQNYKRELFYDLLPENDDTIFTGKLTMKDFEEIFN